MKEIKIRATQLMVYIDNTVKGLNNREKLTIGTSFLRYYINQEVSRMKEELKGGERIREGNSGVIVEKRAKMKKENTQKMS